MRGRGGIGVKERGYWGDGGGIRLKERGYWGEGREGD